MLHYVGGTNEIGNFFSTSSLSYRRFTLLDYVISQIHPFFSRQLLGFIIICQSLGILLSLNLFRRHFRIRAAEN